MWYNGFWHKMTLPKLNNDIFLFRSDRVIQMHGLDQYELRPEIAEPWDYTEVVLREKYPDLPEELFQTPQAARIGQKWLEKGDAAITDYGLIRRKDGSPLPCFRQDQTQKAQLQRGGMKMR